MRWVPPVTPVPRRLKIKDCHECDLKVTLDRRVRHCLERREKLLPRFSACETVTELQAELDPLPVSRASDWFVCWTAIISLGAQFLVLCMNTSYFSTDQGGPLRDMR